MSRRSAARTCVETTDAPVAPDAELRPQPTARMASDVVADNDSPADAPTLEVLDGPRAGSVVPIGRDEFVLGASRRPDRGRAASSGGLPDRAARRRLTRRASTASRLPSEGTLLAVGDEIEIAGTRLLYRPAL